jgi:hypothetical protein
VDLFDAPVIPARIRTPGFLVRALLRLSRSRAVVADFCDRCAQVCTPSCRADAHREQVRTFAATSGLLRF